MNKKINNKQEFQKMKNSNFFYFLVVFMCVWGGQILEKDLAESHAQDSFISGSLWVTIGKGQANFI